MKINGKKVSVKSTLTGLEFYVGGTKMLTMEADLSAIGPKAIEVLMIQVMKKLNA